MEHYSVYELLWLFYIYSFLGWIFEVVLQPASSGNLQTADW